MAFLKKEEGEDEENDEGKRIDQLADAAVKKFPQLMVREVGGLFSPLRRITPTLRSWAGRCVCLWGGADRLDEILSFWRRGLIR